MLMAASNSPVPSPLCAIESEVVVLGSLLLDNRMVDRVADILSADDFYEPFHGRLYDVIVREVSQGRGASITVIRPYIENDPALDELGGISYIGRLVASGAVLFACVDCAKQIADFGKRRRLYDQLGGLVADSHDDLDTPIQSVIDKVDAAMNVALQRDAVAQSMTFGRAFDVTMAEIEAEARGDAPTGLTIDGFDDWNVLTGTMRRGEVVILAGRPSMGKTAVGLGAALGAARAGHGTLFVSLEMSVIELTKRAITDVIFEPYRSASYANVQKGDFSVYDRARLAEAREKLEAWPLILHEDAGLKIGRLAMMIRRYQRQMIARGQKLDCVFVDYLGLIRSDSAKQKRHEEVSEVSRTLKTIARELNIAMVVLSQLNREVEKREDKRPQLHDLRDSGEIEQDADTILFVYREQYYLERSEPNPDDKKRADWEIAMEASRDRLELISAKVRKGSVGKRNCYFYGAHQAVRSSNFNSGRG
jgi:replicative DNA helicase